MDLSQCIDALALALADPEFISYSRSSCETAVYRAVREYSRFRPLLRRMWTGSLVGAAHSGATQIVAAGGPFASGDNLTIDPNSTLAENINLSAVAPAGPNPTQDTPLLLLTLVGPLASNHQDNAD